MQRPTLLAPAYGHPIQIVDEAPFGLGGACLVERRAQVGTAIDLLLPERLLNL